ncbi:MAG: hypothetical protein ABIQ73_21800 [Acidimicrobiales bacterium]
MTFTTITAARPDSASVAGRFRFERIAGIAGVFTVAAGVAQLLIAGVQPGLGASADTVVAFFAKDVDAHKIGVVMSAVLGIPISVFFVGVHRTLTAADRARESSWATLFLVGAIMLSATAGMSEGLYATAVLRRGEGLAPETLRMLNDGSQIARATFGVWIAVALGSVAAATFHHGIRARWYGWFCAAAALLGVLAVIDTVSTGTDGVFAQLAFGIGVIVWLTITSVLMLRDN